MKFLVQLCSVFHQRLFTSSSFSVWQDSFTRNLGSCNSVSPHSQWIESSADSSVRSHRGKMEIFLLWLGVGESGPALSPTKEHCFRKQTRKKHVFFFFVTQHLILSPAIINTLLLYCFYVMLHACMCVCVVVTKWSQFVL